MVTLEVVKAQDWQVCLCVWSYRWNTYQSSIGGFGLGALNDAEDDDLDVYDHSHQQSRRRLAYDQHDGDDDDAVIIGGKGANKNIVQEVCLSLHGLRVVLLTSSRGQRPHCSTFEMAGL